jgi:hypothetical protein
LTPRQLRQLEAFLRAPHNVTPTGSFPGASAISKLTRAQIRFGASGVPDDDKLDLKAKVQIPAGSSFSLAGLASEPITISLADVDEEYFERTIAAGQLRVNAAGTSALFRDRTGPIRSLTVRLRNAAAREYDVKLKGSGVDLELLDKNHVTVALELGDEAFVRTRTFTQGTPARRSISVRER